MDVNSTYYYGGGGENSTVDLPKDTDDKVLGYRPRDITVVHTLLALLGLFGIIGNMISAFVWTKPHLKSSSALLLTVLAVSDLLIVLCLNTLQYLGALLFTYDNSTIERFEKFIWPYVIFWLFPVGFISQTASVYLTLTITLERYMAVCRPFEFQWSQAYSRACKSAVAVVLFSILYNLTRFWEMEVRPEKDISGNITSYSYEPTDLFRSRLYKSLYMNWLYLFFNHILPLGIIIVFNTSIYLNLRAAQRNRSTLTDLQKIENRLTMMLVYVVAEFLLCNSVTTFFALTYIVIDVGGFVVDKQLLEKLVPLDELLYTFNSSFNFVTYVSMKGPFQTEFLRLFGCCCKRQMRIDSQTTNGPHKIDLEMAEPLQQQGKIKLKNVEPQIPNAHSSENKH